MRTTLGSIFFPLVLLVFAGLSLTACSKEPAPIEAAPSHQSAPAMKDAAPSDPAALATAVQPSAGGHAQPNVKPGSHEDWCGEHQVPESLCTRCNSSLVAAFKATGDWCEEHGLPESQCLKCNPDLKIIRPPKEN